MQKVKKWNETPHLNQIFRIINPDYMPMMKTFRSLESSSGIVLLSNNKVLQDLTTFYFMLER